MQDRSQDAPAQQKVLFIRVDEPTYKAVAALADQEDRSINSMTTRLLKSALEQVKQNTSDKSK